MLFPNCLPDGSWEWIFMMTYTWWPIFGCDSQHVHEVEAEDNESHFPTRKFLLFLTPQHSAQTCTKGLSHLPRLPFYKSFSTVVDCLRGPIFFPLSHPLGKQEVQRKKTLHEVYKGSGGRQWGRLHLHPALPGLVHQQGGDGH